MRIQIRNCVTDPRYKHLRQAGTPVFKPVILNKVLVPGAIRIASSSEFDYSDALLLSKLVNSGTCTALEVGKGFVDFELWLSSFDESTEDALPVEEPAVELLEELPEEIIPQPEVSEEVVEVEDSAVESEEIIEEESSIYTESALLEMRNADLREIALGMDPAASVANKSKKKLIALIMGLQNG